MNANTKTESITFDLEITLRTEGGMAFSTQFTAEVLLLGRAYSSVLCVCAQEFPETEFWPRNEYRAECQSTEYGREKSIRTNASNADVQRKVS